MNIAIPITGELHPIKGSTEIKPEDRAVLDRTVNTPLMLDYNSAQEWTYDMVARDILQNFYDDHGGTLDGVKIDIQKVDGKYKVKISGESEYNYFYLKNIAASSKTGDENQAGGYGEGAKMASVSEFVLHDKDKISDLINRGYQFVPDIFYKIGIPDINSAYKKEHRVKSVEPTRVEQQKLRLINEAIQLFAVNDTQGTIPVITPDIMYIYDATEQKTENIHAVVNGKQLNGLFIDRSYLEDTDFLNCVTRMIASSLHVHGNDISANYSYELTDLITSEVNTLMHKPEVAQKLRILQSQYDNLK